MGLIRKFIDDERGITSIEYGVIGVMISILIVTGATLIGSNLRTKFLGPLASGLG